MYGSIIGTEFIRDDYDPTLQRKAGETFGGPRRLPHGSTNYFFGVFSKMTYAGTIRTDAKCADLGCQIQWETGVCSYLHITAGSL